MALYQSMVDAKKASNLPRCDLHSSNLEGTTFFIMSASSEANLRDLCMCNAPLCKIFFSNKENTKLPNDIEN